MFTVKDSGIVFDPQADDEIIDAVIVSLCTMKKADPEELPEHHTDPGGYWADMLEPYEMGSKLWIYNREVRSDETLFKIEQEAIAALEWMKSERLVSDISVSSFFEQDKAVIRINIDNKSIRLNLQ